MKSLGDLMAFGIQSKTPKINSQALTMDQLLARDKELRVWKNEVINKNDHKEVISHSEKLLGILKRYEGGYM